MSIINNMPNKGGININGIIEDYYVYAGENVNAGDFVEYINGVADQKTETSVDTQLNTEANTGEILSATALDNSRVFIAYGYGENYYLYGVVVTVDCATITVGVNAQLSTEVNSGKVISPVLLPNGNVFIAHCYGSVNRLYGTICAINGTTITTGTSKAIYSSSQCGNVISAVAFPNGNVVVFFAQGNSYYYLMGIYVTVDGVNFTPGSTSNDGTEYNGRYISAKLLPNGNIFIAHNGKNDSKYLLHGRVGYVEGEYLYLSDDVQLGSQERSSYYMSPTALPNGNVFIAHSATTSYYLYGVLATISGTTVTAGTDTAINSSQNYTGRFVNSLTLNDDVVAIVHTYSTSYYLHCMFCRISGNTFVLGEDVELDTSMGRNISSVLLNENIFVGYGYGSYLYLYARMIGIDEANNIPTNNVVINEYETQVRKTTTSQFDGVAKTNGAGASLTTGDVIPKIWNEVVKGTQYISDNGVKLTVDVAQTKDGYEGLGCYACDGTDSYWIGDNYALLTLEFPKATKINKIKANYGHIGGTSQMNYFRFQGLDGDTWVNLYSNTSTEGTNGIVECTLSNTKFYKSYRVIGRTKSATYPFYLKELQSSEYEQKDLVSIYTLEGGAA